MEQTLLMALCEIIMTHHPSTCKRALRFQPPPRSPSGHSSHGFSDIYVHIRDIRALFFNRCRSF